MSVPDEQICPMETCALAYAAGELTADERRAVEAHLAECGSCRETTSLISDLLVDEETPDEKVLLDAIEEQTAATARALIRSRIALRNAGRGCDAHRHGVRGLARTIEGPEF